MHSYPHLLHIQKTHIAGKLYTLYLKHTHKNTSQVNSDTSVHTLTYTQSILTFVLPILLKSFSALKKPSGCLDTE